MTSSPPPSPEAAAPLPSSLQFVLQLSPSAMTLGLSNIVELLDRVGNPHRRMRTVVVAGTNGKGSVTAMTAALLAGEGVRTGRFISPHVYSVNERICVDGEAVSMDAMERAADRIAPYYDAIMYSYFEALTAMAFLIFAECGVEVAVLETGLGGRFDATNVTTPVVSVITSISLDHRRILGDTEEEILREKLGVTRPDVPLLIGDFSNALRCHIDARAARDGFPVFDPGDIGDVSGPPGSMRVALRTRTADYGEVQLPFPGVHQRANALISVRAAEAVCGGVLRNLPNSLRSTYLPGRFERMEYGSRTFFLDVAHNDGALCQVARSLGAEAPRDDCAIVFGLLRRKELFVSPAALAASARRLYLVAPLSGGRGERVDPPYEPQDLLVRYFYPELTARRTDAILWHRADADDDHRERLLRALTSDANPCRHILITGSHLMVEQFGRLLRS